MVEFNLSTEEVKQRTEIAIRTVEGSETLIMAATQLAIALATRKYSPGAELISSYVRPLNKEDDSDGSRVNLSDLENRFLDASKVVVGLLHIGTQEQAGYTETDIIGLS